MAVPRAAPSGIFGSGYQPAAAHPLDIGSIIDAATNGASSLLHGAYLRKVAERNFAIAQAERDATHQQRQFQNEQALATQRREVERDAFERQKSERDYKLRERELEQKGREAGLVPGTSTPMISLPGLPDATVTTPEHYDPEHDVALQRGLKLRAKTPAETEGTPEHTAAIEADALARAKAEAKYRQPRSDYEMASQRAAVRQAVQQNRQKYLEGDKNRMGRGALPPVEAGKQAVQDAIEVYGAEAVSDALGAGSIPKLKTPAPAPAGPVATPPWAGRPAIGLPPTGNTPAAGPTGMPTPLRTPSAPAAQPAATPTVAPLMRPTPAAAAPAPSVGVTMTRSTGLAPAPVAAPPAGRAPALLTPATESDMSDADLWEHKRRNGLTADQATAYVRARQKPDEE